MSEFTKEEWRFCDNTKYGWQTHPFSITARKKGVNSATIANIPVRATISLEEAKANARLISAAPALLEALETFPQSIAWTDQDLWDWSKKALEAINKAKGIDQ